MNQASPTPGQKVVLNGMSIGSGGGKCWKNAEIGLYGPSLSLLLGGAAERSVNPAHKLRSFCHHTSHVKSGSFSIVSHVQA